MQFTRYVNNSYLLEYRNLHSTGKSFYDLHIEDMWLPFFCNASVLAYLDNDMHTHLIHMFLTDHEYIDFADGNP